MHYLCSRTTITLLCCTKNTQLSIFNSNPLAAQITTNDDDPNDSGGPAALIDDNPSTFIHSRWGTDEYHDPVYGCYLDIDMKEEVSTIAFDFIARDHPNTAGAPDIVDLYYYDDNDQLVKFATITGMGSQFPTRLSKGSFGPVSAPVAFSKLRLAITHSKGGSLLERDGTNRYWNASAFTLYGW